MNIALIADDIRKWAVEKPLILRVWLFGSRARNDYTTDSDLDVAVELDPKVYESSDESGGIATWMFETEGWKEELQSNCPYTVQLEQFVAGSTPTIARAIAESSLVIYEKST